MTSVLREASGSEWERPKIRDLNPRSVPGPRMAEGGAGQAAAWTPPALLQEQREGFLAPLPPESSFLHTLSYTEGQPICPWSLEPHEEKIILTEWHTRAQDLYPQGDPRHTCSQTLCVPRGGRARRAGRTLRPRAPTIKPLDSSFGSCWVFVRHRSVAFGLSCFLVQVNMDHGLSSSLVHLGIKEHNQAMTRNTSFQIHIYVSSDTWKYV